MPHDSPKGGMAIAHPADSSSPPSEPRRTTPARLAHEINNPLAIVLSNIEFALGELASQDSRGSEMSEALVEARDAVFRIRDLVGAFAATAEEAPPATIHPERASHPAPAGTAKPRVLVVDDEPMLGRAIARGLRDHEVTVVSSGAEALALMRGGQRYDAVLCDLMMPSLPGFDLHEEVSAFAPAQARRMIFMTGGATTTRAREFVECHEGPILQKPVSMNAVRDAVGRLLAARR